MDDIVIFLEYFPIVPDRLITPHTPAVTVYGARFAQKTSYTNWRPHGGADWLLIATESGSGRICAGPETVHTRSGDVLLYEPNAPQDYSTNAKPGHWELLWAHFQPRPDWRRWMEWPLIAPGIRLVNLPENSRRDFAAAMQRMIRYCRRPDPSLAMCALEEALLWVHEAATPGPKPALDERIRKARQILSEEFKTPFSLPELARRCGLSVSRLSHLFQQTGQTPQQFLEQHRLAHARQLLRLTNLSIEQIAADCGYDDRFYFTKRFTRSQGKSPTAYRKAMEGRASARL